MYHLKKAQPNELKISNKCERKMKFDSLDGGAHGEHSGGGFVEISNICDAGCIILWNHLINIVNQ